MKYFCTYRSKKSEKWSRSRDYNSVRDLMAAMFKYVEAHPALEVTFQYSTR